jgi:secernin
MGCDMVVALGPATADRQTLFGQNCHQASGVPALRLAPGREFALGEKTPTQFLELDQVRKTHTVLGSQAPGCWGYQHGLNEFHLAMGCSTFVTRLSGQQPGLIGPDLVRLALERCRTARQAVDLVATLVERHGQGAFPSCPELAETDAGLLIADPNEAFAVEACGHFWVHQEVRQTRAVCDLCIIRQDWDRIAHGLAGLAADRGWWPADGSKLDFGGALGMTAADQAGELRRWGRATLLLEEQNGHIDHAFLRRLLGDHYDGEPDEIDPREHCVGPLPLCRHSSMAVGSVTGASFVAALPAAPTSFPLLSCAFGPPCSCLYLPIFLDGDPWLSQSGSLVGLAHRLQHLAFQASPNRECTALLQENLDRLQYQLDQETAGFAGENEQLKRQRDLPELRRRIGLFVEHVREQVATVINQLEATTLRLVSGVEAVTPF